MYGLHRCLSNGCYSRALCSRRQQVHFLFYYRTKRIDSDDVKGKFENWIFGCDICQDVCPWNSFSQPHAEGRFDPVTLTSFSKQDWKEITDEVFTKVFGKSALKRSKFEGIRRNIAFINADEAIQIKSKKNKPTDFSEGFSLIIFSFFF